ncbi:proactivator polypeptide-like 1 [Nycticebus coucang]|uniref:proactivator polypeptide-like 1 n=1 Tax=Nycticebus coucang TaxID=9470 RepID=UPI00234CC978|nr:proactivator polypeptide-like 1 [Nycticebus coucang]
MLPALLLLSSLLGAIVAIPSLGPVVCVKDPVWPCLDVRAAAKCGAMKQCQRTVWNAPPAKSMQCLICQDMAASVMDTMNHNAKASDNMALLTHSCEWLPNKVASAGCKQMVNTHLSAILSMLHEGSTPATVCTALKICEPLQRHLAGPGPLSKEDSSEAVSPGDVDSFPDHPAHRMSGPVLCPDCVPLVSRLQDAVWNNATLTETNIKDHCESLVPALTILCKKYIWQLSVPVDQVLMRLPSEVVCHRRRLCDKRRPTHLAPEAAADGVPLLELGVLRETDEIQMSMGLTCDLCLSVVRQLDKWLISNRTQAKVSKALRHVCSVMPSSIAQRCITFVNKYSSALMEFVAKLTPERLCRTIRLCRSLRLTREVHETYEAKQSPEMNLTVNRGHFCNGCKRLFTVSSHNLDHKSTKRDILLAFKGGCSVLPLPYMIQCNHFVTQYEPVLIESLKDVMDPEALCKKVGACHDPKPLLLGTDQCVTGPSFWCTSQEAAELCNAVQHCQSHVWKTTPLQAGEQA